jgi:hypothetical protein
MNNIILNSLNHHRMRVRRNRRFSIVCLFLAIVLIFPTLKFYYLYLDNYLKSDLYGFLFHIVLFLVFTILAFLKK